MTVQVSWRIDNIDKWANLSESCPSGAEFWSVARRYNDEDIDINYMEISKKKTATHELLPIVIDNI